jgi:hypothetical protein
MRTIGRDRLWLIGGLVAALLLVGIAWQFVISSQNDTTNSVKNDVASAQLQAVNSRRTLNQLRADNANIDKYKAALAAAQQALPAATGMPALLRELHTAGNQTAVAVVSLQVGTPQSVTPAAVTTATTTGSAATTDGLSGAVYEISVTAVATGATANLDSFLQQIQQLQPRAILLMSVSEAPGASAGQTQLTAVMQVFVAPTDGKTPAVS